MNCFDCAALGDHVDAVAICADCGAAVCHDHAHVTARWLTRTMVINRVVAVEPPARTIRCGICQAARDAAPQLRGGRLSKDTKPRPAGHGRRAFVVRAAPGGLPAAGARMLAPGGNDFLPPAAIMSVYTHRGISGGA